MGQQLQESLIRNRYGLADQVHLFRGLHRPETYQIHILPADIRQGFCQGTLFRIGKIVSIQGQVLRIRQLGRFRPESMLVFNQFTFRRLLTYLQSIPGIRDDHRPPGIHIQQAFSSCKPGEVPDGGIAFDKDAIHLFLFQESPQPVQSLHPIVSSSMVEQNQFD